MIVITPLEKRNAKFEFILASFNFFASFRVIRTFYFINK